MILQFLLWMFEQLNQRMLLLQECTISMVEGNESKLWKICSTNRGFNQGDYAKSVSSEKDIFLRNLFSVKNHQEISRFMIEISHFKYKQFVWTSCLATQSYNLPPLHKNISLACRLICSKQQATMQNWWQFPTSSSTVKTRTPNSLLLFTNAIRDLQQSLIINSQAILFRNKNVQWGGREQALSCQRCTSFHFRRGSDEHNGLCWLWNAHNEKKFQ